ncbi:MAG: hypothetical protein JWR00_4543, partial [Rubritepida sp.]|nr:hypothetical protein [Rubritepida sp.]
GMTVDDITALTSRIRALRTALVEGSEEPAAV